MKKVVVTGGLGFIGSNLIKILLEKKYYVINVDKITYSSNFYNVKEFSKNQNYKFFKLDINNRKKLLYILKKYKPSAIFNLAAKLMLIDQLMVQKNLLQVISWEYLIYYRHFEDLLKKIKNLN